MPGHLPMLDVERTALISYRTPFYFSLKENFRKWIDFKSHFSFKGLRALWHPPYSRLFLTHCRVPGCPLVQPGQFSQALAFHRAKKLSLEWHFVCVVTRQSHPEHTLEDISTGPVMLFYAGATGWGKALRSGEQDGADTAGWGGWCPGCPCRFVWVILSPPLREKVSCEGREAQPAVWSNTFTCFWLKESQTMISCRGISVTQEFSLPVMQRAWPLFTSWVWGPNGYWLHILNLYFRPLAYSNFCVSCVINQRFKNIGSYWGFLVCYCIQSSI